MKFYRKIVCVCVCVCEVKDTCIQVHCEKTVFQMNIVLVGLGVLVQSCNNRSTLYVRVY